VPKPAVSNRSKQPYSITSSARPISGSGIVKPRALAVFRLMINSTLVACWTGRSCGFSPFRGTHAPYYTAVVRSFGEKPRLENGFGVRAIYRSAQVAGFER
jgi:hypothetical protein